MSSTYSYCPSCKSLNKVLSSKASETKVCGKCQAALPMHSLVTEIDTEGFRKIVAKSELPVVVDFWASWCGPCKAYGPQFERASTLNTGAVFLKVNTEKETQLSAEFDVRSIPCTIIFKSGKEVKRQMGAIDAATLGSLLK